jgi:predicted Holliday junction resolvase-like endonuclease
VGKTTVCLMVAWLLSWGALHSQSVNVNGYFLEDSVKLGSPARYVLVAEYPGSIKVLFPDSTHRFAPFEFNKQTFFPSKLRDGSVVDSVIYELSTFELEPYQSLQLPVFRLREKDSLKVLSNIDSLFIDGLLDEIPQDAKLKETVGYSPLDFAFNYPYLVIGSIIFLIIVITIFLVFGKTVRKKITLYRMRKKYEKFSNSFTEQLRTIRANNDIHEAESAFISWKSYLEALEKVPYTKLTTKEILKGEENEKLRTALKNIDKNIYGRVGDNELFKQFEALEDICQDKYNKKVEEVKHG